MKHFSSLNADFEKLMHWSVLLFEIYEIKYVQK